MGTRKMHKGFPAYQRYRLPEVGDGRKVLKTRGFCRSGALENCDHVQ